MWCRQAAAQGHERAQAHLDVITAPPPPGPFDPPDPPAPATGGDLFDRVRRNRIRLERGAAAVDAILDRVLPRAHQLDASFDRIDAATRRLDNIIRRAEDLERDHVTRRQGLFKTIHALSNVAERAQRRIQAITAALKTRDTETRAIEARLRQTMTDRTGDPDGPSAAADAAAADSAPEDQTPPTARW